MTGPSGPILFAAPKRPRFVVLITAVRAGLAFAIGLALLLVADRGEVAPPAPRDPMPPVDGA
jgi:hypothetical protein